MGEEMLLGGVRTVPTKLLQSGFEFLHPSIDEAIASAIEDTI
jgi:NAD dependent epimerase/dehydratase family enzyme